VRHSCYVWPRSRSPSTRRHLGAGPSRPKSQQCIRPVRILYFCLGRIMLTSSMTYPIPTLAAALMGAMLLASPAPTGTGSTWSTAAALSKNDASEVPPGIAARMQTLSAPVSPRKAAATWDWTAPDMIYTCPAQDASLNVYVARNDRSQMHTSLWPSALAVSPPADRPIEGPDSRPATSKIYDCSNTEVACLIVVGWVVPAGVRR
jgi:hypothetical protein